MPYPKVLFPTEQAAAEYIAGMTVADLAKKYQVAFGTVRNRLLPLGVLDSSRKGEQSGAKNPAWKGGTSRSHIGRLTKKILSDAGVDLRLCMRCGYRSASRNLDRHHRDRNRNNNDLLNLEVLCVSCHNSGSPQSEHQRKRGPDGRLLANE